MSTYEMWATGISGLTLIIISIQLFLLYKSFVADHERRKKQATVEFAQATFKDIQICQRELLKKFKNNVINIDDFTDDNDWKHARELMANLELLATGVNTKVYDIEIIDRMLGSFLISMHKKMWPYIDHQREGGKRQSVYTEFLNLAQEISSRRNQSKNIGAVKHS